MMYFNTLSSEENIYEYMVTKRRKLYAEMGFTESGNGGLFERESGPCEGEEERSEKHGKVFQTEDGHDTTRFGEAV